MIKEAPYPKHKPGQFKSQSGKTCSELFSSEQPKQPGIGAALLLKMGNFIQNSTLGSDDCKRAYSPPRHLPCGMGVGGGGVGGPFGGGRSPRSDTPRPNPCGCGAHKPVVEQCNECNTQMELQSLKNEVGFLRNKMTQMQCHKAAQESAEMCCNDMEKDFRRREQCYQTKEQCLKVKIKTLQDVLRDDARAASENICRLEESERELKCNLMRMSKKNHELCEDQKLLCAKFEKLQAEHERMVEAQQPLGNSLEQEKRRCKCLKDELEFAKRMQQEAQAQNLAQIDDFREQITDLKRAQFCIEIENNELKERCCCLEKMVCCFQANEDRYLDKIRCLYDEMLIKDEQLHQQQNCTCKTQRISQAPRMTQEISQNYKRERCQRSNATDLRSATACLGTALQNITDCQSVPMHGQLQTVALDVKKLADALISAPPPCRNSMGVTRLESGADPPPSTDSSQITVAIALMPQYEIIENNIELPRVEEMKPPIFEVPSELRKIHAQRPAVDQQQISQQKLSKRRKRHSHRKNFPVGRIPKLQSRVRPIVSLYARHEPQFYDLPSSNEFSDFDLHQTEVLQRKVSYESFQSVKTDATEPTKADATEQTDTDITEQPKVDFTVQAEMDALEEPKVEVVELVKIDAFTNTHCTLVDKETETGMPQAEPPQEITLDELPAETRRFFCMLKSAMPHSTIESNHINYKLLSKWKSDGEFRAGLDILQNFVTFIPNSDNSNLLNSYDSFVCSFTSINNLEEIFKPLKIPMLKVIEDQINEQLMHYHSKRIEKEFYCTVYYPVKRQAS